MPVISWISRNTGWAHVQLLAHWAAVSQLNVLCGLEVVGGHRRLGTSGLGSGRKENTLEQLAE